MKTILIADDMAFSRAIIKTFISKLDIEVVGEAENGKDAVEKYKKLMPDIVTMDITMDGGDGIEALREIMQYNPEAVVFIISSTGSQKYKIDETMELGAKKVFKKPIEKDEFIHEIKKYID